MENTKSHSRKRILLLDGHTRQVLPMAKALRRNGFHTTVLCPSLFSIGYVSRWPSERLLYPCAKEDATGFLKRLKEILQQDKYDVVIPLFDYSAEIVCKHKDLLSRWSRIAVNDHDIFMKARDKSQTMKICMGNNIPCPQTVFPDESTIEECLEDLTFPVAKGYSHYFYGSTPEVLSAMKEAFLARYPNLCVKKFYSPPFRPLTGKDIQDIADEINLLCPTFLWVGLGAPKQEIFMKNLVNRVEQTILLGVGLAFDYSSGKVKRAPRWMQKCGMEWIARLYQQPDRINVASISRLFTFLIMLLAAALRRFVFGKWNNPKTSAE